MANLMQLDLRARGGEARIRALLEDLISYYKGVYPAYQLALTVWYGKSPDSSEHNLLALFTGPPMDGFAPTQHQSLTWKTGLNGPPFANIYATSVDYFMEQLKSNPTALTKFKDKYEVLYFDKQLLSNEILRAFNIITEPSRLVKGWYVGPSEYSKSETAQSLLAAWSRGKPYVGVVTTAEDTGFENRRGILHVEVEQRWLPVSPGGVRNFTFYQDWQGGRPGYFMFEAGAFYEIRKFEVVTVHEYSALVLEKPRDDRYVEVYLRAVYPPEQPTA